MGYPGIRPRRLRVSSTLRRMVRESNLSVDDLIYPLFVVHGKGVKEPVASMPGVFRFSPDTLVREAGEVYGMGIPSVILFGIPAYKDGRGSSAWDPGEVLQQSIARLKDAFPRLVVISDACICEYSSDGHCGLVEGDKVLNDPTLETLVEVALSHARAGVDMVAPSDMMDGRVGAIRRGLDREGFDQVALMSYGAKFASSFYGPFREAAGSAPAFGDRKTYQVDPANRREALKEIQLDVEEGADLVMVKPALAYLDIIREVKDHTLLPVAAYNVSGEYAMVQAAGQAGWLEVEAVQMEILMAIKRAGADLILTYYAREAARLL